MGPSSHPFSKKRGPALIGSRVQPASLSNFVSAPPDFIGRTTSPSPCPSLPFASQPGKTSQSRPVIMNIGPG